MKKWHFNYLNGTKYELYRVPFKKKKFSGFKFRELCMILYKKENLTLIGLEIKVGNQIKVFLNPADYVFEECDHWGYVINHEKPDFQRINNMDLTKHAAENFFIMHYITIREPSTNKKEQKMRHRQLSNLYEEYENKRSEINFENFHTSKRPVSLQEARDSNCLPKNLE